MKYLLILLLIIGCSKDEIEKEPSISLSSCSNIAKMLDGSFAYAPTTSVPCSVYIEGNTYAFYSDDQESGISFGLAMATNRPKLKQFKECVQSTAEDINASTEEAVKIDRDCRKKLGMKDYY